ncbi:MAG: metal ABC transporter solute-binding protein, Zn/Mn family [Microcoleaceae cyanobacterium]
MNRKTRQTWNVISRQIKSWNLKLAIAAGIVLGTGLTGCTPTNQVSTEENQPRVVSTSTIIADLVTTIGAGEISHQGILKPGTDPHVYEPVPQNSIAFEKADLIFYNGYNLEPGLIKLMNAAGVSAAKIPLAESIPPLDFQKGGKTQPDPHVWGDVENILKMVEDIRDQLIKLSPDDQAIFTENAAQLTEELKQLDLWIQQQIATIPENQRQLVTTHDAFQYYARAYGLEVAGTLIGISTEEQPSAQTVKKLADEIRQAKVPAIFAETTINPQLIQTVATEAGVKLADQELYSDSIGAPGSRGESYVQMLVANTQTIVEALGGTVTPFEPRKSNVE